MKLFINILIILIGVLGIGGLAFGHYYINYQYENIIGSYFNNAIDMNTPDKMLEQLEAGKQGMIKEGLTEDMYGAWIFKKPDNSMKFQYQHIDSIIERVKAVDNWYKETYKEGSTNTETLGDVYEQKMTNLRHFIAEDLNEGASRSDWIAKDAWYVNKHFFWYFTVYSLYLLFILIASIGLLDLCYLV